MMAIEKNTAKKQEVRRISPGIRVANRNRSTSVEMQHITMRVFRTEVREGGSLDISEVKEKIRKLQDRLGDDAAKW